MYQTIQEKIRIRTKGIIVRIRIIVKHFSIKVPKKLHEMITNIKYTHIKSKNTDSSSLKAWNPYFSKNGVPEKIRTPDLLIRSQTLYPAELLAHF